MAQAQRTADFQRTIELVNKFTLSSIQFLNRFGAQCESKLLTINRQLQRLETQVTLLEYKLDSIDRDDDDDDGQPAAKPQPKASAPLAITSGPSAPPPPMATKKQPPPPPGMGGPVAPQMPGFGGGGSAPPMPGGKMPPPPPGFGPPRPGGAAPLALMPPPQLGQAPVGFTPPPPPPMQLGVSVEKQMRNHPRLQGYFRMLDAGVPAASVKQKMQVDGLNPQWLDTPEALAPAGIAAPKNDTLYDSD